VGLHSAISEGELAGGLLRGTVASSAVAVAASSSVGTAQRDLQGQDRQNRELRQYPGSFAVVLAPSVNTASWVNARDEDEGKS
jgi:hypothetical protein